MASLSMDGLGLGVFVLCEIMYVRRILEALTYV